jgi:outer membrane immunogenic protein
MRKLIAAAAGLSALLSLPMAATAADLPAAAPPPVKAPVYEPPPFSWTGFYLGGNLGGAWASNNWTLTDPTFTTGFVSPGDDNFIGGGQLGFNYQMGNFVWGVEGEAEYFANNNGNAALTALAPVTANGVTAADTLQVVSNNTWMATVAARFGFALDRTLYYAKAGWGWVGNSGLTFTDQTSGGAISLNSFNQNGWLVGAGVEFAFAYNWTVKLEYSYLNLGSQTFTVPATAPIVASDTFTTGPNNIQSIKLGINYLFNWGSPVVARY